MNSAEKVQLLYFNSQNYNSIPMRKAIFTLFLFFSLAFQLSAQIRVGILGGAQQSTVIETNSLPNWNDIKNDYSGRIGYHGGIIADMPFSPKSKVYFQPGVIFYNKGRKYVHQFDQSTSTLVEQRDTQFVNYIDVPLNLVLKFGKKIKFVIGGGPYGSFFFNGKESSRVLAQGGNITYDENKDLAVGKKPGQYRIMNYGVNALAGVEIGRVFITANYSRGLNDFYQAADYDGSFKHQVIGGTLGVFLGKPVSFEKKIKDKDKDGVPDDKDACPDEPGPALTNGCPDRDGDGIADKDDACPDKPGTLANHGCPDTDNDGIADNVDKCPDVPGVAKYNGCPIPDTDGDGINDENDKCPTVPGSAKYNGCPVPDTDGDGINDEEDKCPTEKGVKENNGCPAAVKEVIVEKVNYAAKRIQFQVSKAVLLPSSYPLLDDVANILKEDASLKLLIEGHTSSDGSLPFNMKLSEDRARSVQNYLVSKGVDPARISIVGYGPTRPLNEGRTKAEREQNRRVELKLSN